MTEKKPAWRYLGTNFPTIYTEKSFLFLIGFKNKDFFNIVDNKKLFYNKEDKPKKSGGFREIFKPNPKLKFLLKKINKKYLSKIDFPRFLHCGPKGRSIMTATRGHKNFTYHLSLDIESFFDKVNKSHVFNSLRQIGINKKISTLITDVATEDDKLPQGFPTSPLLSALVLSYSLQDFYNVFDKNKIILSVYVDDILLSSNNKKMLGQGKKYIADNINRIGLSLNSKETFAKNGQHFKWLGLYIYPWATLPRKDLLLLEKQIYRFKTLGEIPPDYKPRKRGELKKLWEKSTEGKLVFAQSINNNKLIRKSLKNLKN